MNVNIMHSMLSGKYFGKSVLHGKKNLPLFSLLNSIVFFLLKLILYLIFIFSTKEL